MNINYLLSPVDKVVNCCQLSTGNIVRSEYAKLGWTVYRDKACTYHVPQTINPPDAQVVDPTTITHLPTIRTEHISM